MRSGKARPVGRGEKEAAGGADAHLIDVLMMIVKISMKKKNNSDDAGGADAHLSHMLIIVKIRMTAKHYEPRVADYDKKKD